MQATVAVLQVKAQIPVRQIDYDFYFSMVFVCNSAQLVFHFEILVPTIFPWFSPLESWRINPFFFQTDFIQFLVLTIS